MLCTEARGGAQRDGGTLIKKSIFEVYESIQNCGWLESRFLCESIFSPTPIFLVYPVSYGSTDDLIWYSAYLFNIGTVCMDYRDPTKDPGSAGSNSPWLTRSDPLLK